MNYESDENREEEREAYICGGSQVVGVGCGLS